MSELCGCCQRELPRMPLTRWGVLFCCLECISEYQRDHDDDVVPERDDA